jgi:hypothetical protein
MEWISAIKARLRLFKIENESMTTGAMMPHN